MASSLASTLLPAEVRWPESRRFGFRTLLAGLESGHRFIAYQLCDDSFFTNILHLDNKFFLTFFGNVSLYIFICYCTHVVIYLLFELKNLLLGTAVCLSNDWNDVHLWD
jgi:hypothetical protein